MLHFSEHRKSYVLAVILCCLSSRLIAGEIADLRQKAEAGDINSQIALGDLYREPYGSFVGGQRVEPNLEIAERWYKEAAKTNLTAKARLAGLYSDCSFARRDETASAHLFAQVAGDERADRDLLSSVETALADILYQESPGYLISLGCGPDKASPVQNYQAAAFWYKKAIEHGSKRAKFQLATMYEAGKGVPQDFREAEHLYQAAAEDNDEQAHVMLGELYKRIDDLPHAYMWFNVGASLGKPQAEERRQKLASRMSSKDILAGQELSRAYLAKHSPSKNCSWSRCN